MIAYYSPGKPLGQKRNSIFRVAYYAFLICGVAAIGYSGYVVADAHAYQAVEQTKFERAGASHVHHPVVDGDAVGEMEVPRLGLKAIFVQGDSASNLRHAVGHMSDTALPGEQGNVVLTGHRDSFFRPLRHILTGDTIKVKTQDGEFEYRVESSEVVLPSDTKVLQPSSANTLTLVTCFPFYYVGPAPKRFIVHAREIRRLPAQTSGEDAPIS